MGKWGWILAMAEPTLLAATLAIAGVPLLLLPKPVGLLVAGLGVVAVLWFNYRLEMSVRRLPVRVGPEALLGQDGRVVEALNPSGLVCCDGELWRAVERRGLPAGPGERVVVVRVRGLELEVEVLR